MSELLSLLEIGGETMIRIELELYDEDDLIELVSMIGRLLEANR